MHTWAVCGILLLGCFQVSFGDFPDEYITRSDRECLKELNLDTQVLKDAFGKHFTLEEGNPRINEFLLCTFKKTSYFTEDGKINVEVMKEWLEVDFFRLFNRDDIQNRDKVADEIMSDCSIVHGADEGDTAVKVYNCMIHGVVSYLGNKNET